MRIALHRRDGCPHLSTLLFSGVVDVGLNFYDCWIVFRLVAVVFHPNAADSFAIAVAFAFVVVGLGPYSL